MSQDHDHHGDDHVHNHGEHGHSHGARHVHAPANFGTAFAVGIALNAGFVIVEVVYGVLGNSVALFADAGHNLGDVLGLLVAWVASVLVKRAPSARFTYGLRSSSILAALFRLQQNSNDRRGDWHCDQWRLRVAVCLGPQGRSQSAGILRAHGGGRTRIGRRRGGRSCDVADRLALARSPREPRDQCGHRLGTWSLLREFVGMSLAAVPAQIDPAAVRRFIANRDGVGSLHDLHIWPMSTTEIALTCHLVMPAGHPGDAFIHELCEGLADQFQNQSHHCANRGRASPRLRPRA